MNSVIWAAIAVGGSTLLGTGIGFLLGKVSDQMQSAVVAFAAGVMLSAAVFGLYTPAMEAASGWACLLIVSGSICGVLFLRCIALLSDKLGGNGILKAHPELMFVVAIAVHKLPEGMAGGVGLCGINAAAAKLTALGVALQNLPEGAVMIPPMLNAGVKKYRAAAIALITGLANAAGVFVGAVWGELSGAILPFTLSFAGGAMLDVIVAQMIPQIAFGRFRFGNAVLMGGFLLMAAINLLF